MTTKCYLFWGSVDVALKVSTVCLLIKTLFFLFLIIDSPEIPGDEHHLTIQYVSLALSGMGCTPRSSIISVFQLLVLP